mgnify:CR=1 FL=1
MEENANDEQAWMSGKKTVALIIMVSKNTTE